MELGVIEIKQCPVCVSTKRYVEEMTKQAKEDGVVSPGSEYSTHIFRNTVPGRGHHDQLPLGAKIWVYEVWMDVCLGYPDKPCGNLYAVKLVTGTATKQHKLVMPGGQPDLPFSSS